MKILFICTGNTCRSPMAEYYLNSLHLPDVSALSAGVYATGEAISENSAAVMEEIGINAASHISRPLPQDLVNGADRIYCMTPSHKELLLSLGVNSDKVFLLREGGVSDPFGGDLDTYRKCRDQITDSINGIFEYLHFAVSYLVKEDAERLAALEKLCFSTPWSIDSIKSAMDGANTFLGVCQNGEITGYLSFSSVAGECYINNIAVHPDFRRKGVAKAMLCELFNIAVSSYYEFISLEVRESNLSARNLYNAFGFKEEGRRKNYYTAPQEDAIILTRRF